MSGLCWRYLYVFFFGVFGIVRVIKEFFFEKLNCDDSKDEYEEFVDDEDVEDVF